MDDTPILHALVLVGRCGIRALAGEDLKTIMQKVFRKRPSTAWRYMRLIEVVAGNSGNSVNARVSGVQYREINAFPLQEHSRARAAFGN